MADESPQVGIVLGSDSDLEIMRPALEVLQQLDITFEATVASAHRSPGASVTCAGRGSLLMVPTAKGAPFVPFLNRVFPNRTRP